MASGVGGTGSMAIGACKGGGTWSNSAESTSSAAWGRTALTEESGVPAAAGPSLRWAPMVGGILGLGTGAGTTFASPRPAGGATPWTAAVCTTCGDLLGRALEEVAVGNTWDGRGPGPLGIIEDGSDAPEPEDGAMEAGNAPGPLGMIKDGCCAELIGMTGDDSCPGSRMAEIRRGPPKSA